MSLDIVIGLGLAPGLVEPVFLGEQPAQRAAGLGDLFAAQDAAQVALAAILRQTGARRLDEQARTTHLRRAPGLAGRAGKMRLKLHDIGHHGHRRSSLGACW